jgi:hypothetical protein
VNEAGEHGQLVRHRLRELAVEAEDVLRLVERMRDEAAHDLA